MNTKIIQFLKGVIKERGLKYAFISERTGIDYQRVIRIFSHNATLSGSELILLAKFLDLDQKQLMALIDQPKSA